MFEFRPQNQPLFGKGAHTPRLETEPEKSAQIASKQTFIQRGSLCFVKILYALQFR